MSERESKELQKFEEKNESVLRPNDITGKSAQSSEFTDRVLNEQVKFHQRLFPNKSEKTIIEYQNTLLERRAEANIETHRMLYEFQKESVKTALNAVLLEGKAAVEGKGKIVFALRIKELQDRMRALLDEHNTSMDDAFRKLTDIKTVSVRKQNEEFLLRLSAKFYINIEDLIDSYREIINNLVK